MKKLLYLVVVLVVFVSCKKEQQLYRIQENGLYGFIDSLGNIAIEPQYKYVSHFTKEGYAFVISKMLLSDNGVKINYGYINKENELVIDTNNIFQMQNADLDFKTTVDYYNERRLDFNDDLFPLLYLRDGRYVFQDSNTGKIGFKDINGNVVIEAIYDRASHFSNGVAAVQKKTTKIPKNASDNNCWGVINPDGTTAVAFEYGIIQDYTKDGKTWTTTFFDTEDGGFDCECAQIDKNGKVLIGPLTMVQHVYNNSRSNIYSASINRYNRFFNNWFTFIDENGKILTDYNGDGMITGDFFEGGKMEWFYGITYFSEGRVGIKGSYQDNPAWWFVDKNFERQSEAYDSLKSYSEGLAAVKELSSYGEYPAHWGKWGYINKENEVVIPFKYSECGSFVKGLAYFKIDGNSFDIEGYINKLGKSVWQAKKKKEKTETQ